MSDVNQKPVLNHYAFLRFTDRYWNLDADIRKQFHDDWFAAIEAAADHVWTFQSYPAEPTVDFMVWSVVTTDGPDAADAFFKRFATAMTPYRHLVSAEEFLWGFTRPSQYSKARSKQEIDPSADERQPYLIVYPFVKTVDWYLLGQESRQGMMNEHIRIGKQYTDIKQLLLYSFGLQNQEFVVVYEAADPLLFSDLVKELRNTEARRYTERDSPLHTAVYRTPEELFALWR